MFTMDLKCTGITWVGNIYQKLEAMYMEVEEIMYQETTKYAEEQAQTAGVDVKKFAEIVQDLLPPSSVNPLKGIDPDLRVEENADVWTCKKSKEDFMKNPIIQKLPSPRELGAVATDGKNLSQGSFFSGLPIASHLPPSSVEPVEGAGNGLSLEQNDVIYEKSKVGVKEYTIMEKQPSPKVSEVISSVGKDSSGASFFSGVHDVDEKACSTPSKMSTLTSGEVTKNNCPSRSGKIRNDLLDAIGRVSGVHPSTTYETISLMQSSGNEQGHYYDCAELQATLRPSESDTLCDASQAVTGRSDGYNAGELAEGNDTIRSGVENIEALDNMKLEEGYILVDSNELSFVSQRTGRRRSYKKKIREAFASKMRSGKKQEYEQLAFGYGDINGGIDEQRVESSTLSSLAGDLNSKKLPNHDLCESEWKLL